MTTPTTAAVYASKGGTRYHADRFCQAMLLGRWFWRFDPQQWVPGMPLCMLTDGYDVRETTITDALGAGKRPCHVCLADLDAYLCIAPSEQDFGHEPVEYDGVPICRRCYVTETREWVDAHDNPRRSTARGVVPWPCTSAVVLGLTPRTAPAPVPAA